MNYYEIGQRIRKIRKAHGLSQEELAEKIGILAEMVNISTVHMSHIETGNTKLSLPVLVSIASVLEVQTDDLLFEQVNASRSNALNEIAGSLDNCSSQELKIIQDIVRATKTALQKYK